MYNNNINYENGLNSIKFGDTSNLDAFGRLRVSNIFTIFDSKSITTISDIFFDKIFSGGTINYIPTESSRELVITGSTGSYAILQTKRSFNYQPGKSQLVLLTGILSIEKDVIKRIGIFDSDTGSTYQPKNGMYFETDGKKISINVIKNTTGITKIYQENWNIDKLDGSLNNKNKSLKKLDLNKSQIFVIDYEWLGVGRIRFGFNIDGQTIYCHEILNANNIEGVYISYPNLPIRVEIRSIGGSGSLRQICSMISSEGGFQPNGIIRGISTSTGLTIGSGVSRPLIAIRLNDFAKNIDVVLTRISCFASDEGDFIWGLRYYEGTEQININSTPTNWENISFNNLIKSNIEYKFFTTNDIIIQDQGIIIASSVINAVGSVGSTTGGGNFVLNDIKNALQLGNKITGERDVILLEIQNISGVSDTYFGSINWREL